jgi:hypothetical protein
LDLVFALFVAASAVVFEALAVFERAFFVLSTSVMAASLLAQAYFASRRR